MVDSKKALVGAKKITVRKVTVRKVTVAESGTDLYTVIPLIAVLSTSSVLAQY